MLSTGAPSFGATFNVPTEVVIRHIEGEEIERPPICARFGSTRKHSAARSRSARKLLKRSGRKTPERGPLSCIEAGLDKRLVVRRLRDCTGRNFK